MGSATCRAEDQGDFGQLELKRLVLLLTHWVEASAEFVLLSKPHEYWRWFDHTATYTDFKKEMWVHFSTSFSRTSS